MLSFEVSCCVWSSVMLPAYKEIIAFLLHVILLQRLQMHIIEKYLLPVAINPALPSVTSSIMTFLCSNILFLWVSESVLWINLMVMWTVGVLMCNMNVQDLLIFQFFWSLLVSMLTFYVSLCAGEGCPLDHGSDF